MTGQEALIQMRRAGSRPPFVFVVDGDSEYDRIRSGDWHVEPNQFAQRIYAHLRVLATDVPEALDLRCLVGLRVQLIADRTAERGHRLFEAIKAASPKFLIAEIGDAVKTYPEVIYG
jgi:hypothetical protein